MCNFTWKTQNRLFGSLRKLYIGLFCYFQWNVALLETHINNAEELFNRNRKMIKRFDCSFFCFCFFPFLFLDLGTTSTQYIVTRKEKGLKRVLSTTKKKLIENEYMTLILFQSKLFFMVKRTWDFFISNWRYNQVSNVLSKGRSWTRAIS